MCLRYGLWRYRGAEPWTTVMGHEYVGIVDETGYRCALVAVGAAFAGLLRRSAQQEALEGV